MINLQVDRVLHPKTRYIQRNKTKKPERRQKKFRVDEGNATFFTMYPPFPWERGRRQVVNDDVTGRVLDGLHDTPPLSTRGGGGFKVSSEKDIVFAYSFP